MAARYGGRFAAPNYESEARRIQKEPIVVWRKEWVHPKGASTSGAGASSASSGVKIMKWVRTGETVQFPEEDDANDLLLQQQQQLQEQQLQQQQQQQVEHSQLEMQPEADASLTADTQTLPEGQTVADASDKLEGTNATGASDAMEVDQRPGVEEMDLADGADLHAEQAAADLLEQAHEDVQEEMKQGGEGKTVEQDTAVAIPEPGPDNDIAALAKEQGSIATDDVEERLQAPVEAEETGEKSQELLLNEEEGDASKSVPSAMQIQVDQQPLQ